MQTIGIKPTPYLCEKLPSTVNAISTSLLAADIIRTEFNSNTLFHYSPKIDKLFSTVLSFTIYDILILILERDTSLQIWAHHLVTFLGCYYIRVYKTGVVLPVIYTVTESTLPFSNLVYILQKLQIKDSRYTFALVLRALSFLLIRSTSWITPFIIIRQKLKKSKQDFWKSVERMPAFVVALSCLNAVTLSSLNLYWTRQTCMAVVRHFKGKSGIKTVHHI